PLYAATKSCERDRARRPLPSAAIDSGTAIRSSTDRAGQGLHRGARAVLLSTGDPGWLTRIRLGPTFCRAFQLCPESSRWQANMSAKRPSEMALVSKPRLGCDQRQRLFRGGQLNACPVQAQAAHITRN